MPRYEHDPTLFTASITILPKDDYEFEVGRPKAFERTAKKGHQSYGIGIPLTVVSEGPMRGKKTYLWLYLHSDGAAQMSKRFQIAAAGYLLSEANEKIYDAEVAGKDWSYDTDSGHVGEEWRRYEKRHVCCDVDTAERKDDDGTIVKDPNTGEPIVQQVWGVWRPLIAEAVGA